MLQDRTIFGRGNEPDGGGHVRSLHDFDVTKNNLVCIFEEEKNQLDGLFSLFPYWGRYHAGGYPIWRTSLLMMMHGYYRCNQVTKRSCNHLGLAQQTSVLLTSSLSLPPALGR